jgi:hypothetical protein
MNLCTPGSISGSHWGEWTPGRFQSHQSADFLVWIEHVRVALSIAVFLPELLAALSPEKTVLPRN